MYRYVPVCTGVYRDVPIVVHTGGLQSGGGVNGFGRLAGTGGARTRNL